MIYHFHITVMMLNPLAYNFFDRHFNQLAPMTLDYRGKGLNETKLSKTIRKYYFGNDEITYRNLKIHADVSFIYLL